MIGPGIGYIIQEIAAEVSEVEHHLHNREKWFGVAGTPAAETHVADRMAGGVSPFQLIAGSDDFGSWVQILGSSDTPVEVGKTKFDAHRVLVTDSNSTNPFIIQIADGESSELAALVLAEEFTEFAYVSATNNNDSGISDVISKRVSSGVKVWARAACIGSSGSTIDLFFGIHEYNE